MDTGMDKGKRGASPDSEKDSDIKRMRLDELGQLREELAESKRMLEESKRMLEERDRGLEERDRGLEERDRVLAESKRKLEERDRVLERVLAESKRKLEERDRELEEEKAKAYQAATEEKKKFLAKAKMLPGAAPSTWIQRDMLDEDGNLKARFANCLKMEFGQHPLAVSLAVQHHHFDAQMVDEKKKKEVISVLHTRRLLLLSAVVVDVMSTPKLDSLKREKVGAVRKGLGDLDEDEKKMMKIIDQLNCAGDEIWKTTVITRLMSCFLSKEEQKTELRFQFSDESTTAATAFGLKLTMPKVETEYKLCAEHQCCLTAEGTSSTDICLRQIKAGAAGEVKAGPDDAHLQALGEGRHFLTEETCVPVEIDERRDMGPITTFTLNQNFLQVYLAYPILEGSEIIVQQACITPRVSVNPAKGDVWKVAAALETLFFAARYCACSHENTALEEELHKSSWFVSVYMNEGGLPLSMQDGWEVKPFPLCESPLLSQVANERTTFVDKHYSYLGRNVSHNDQRRAVDWVLSAVLGRPAYFEQHQLLELASGGIRICRRLHIDGTMDLPSRLHCAAFLLQLYLLHVHGIVHGDIRMENIIAGNICKLCDIIKEEKEAKANAQVDGIVDLNTKAGELAKTLGVNSNAYFDLYCQVYRNAKKNAQLNESEILYANTHIHDMDLGGVQEDVQGAEGVQAAVPNALDRTIYVKGYNDTINSRHPLAKAGKAMHIAHDVHAALYLVNKALGGENSLLHVCDTLVVHNEAVWSLADRKTLCQVAEQLIASEESPLAKPSPAKAATSKVISPPRETLAKKRDSK